MMSRRSFIPDWQRVGVIIITTVFRQQLQSLVLKIELSKVRLQRRLIGVKSVKKSNRVSILTTLETEREVDALGSPVINVARMPIYWTSSTPQ